MWRAREGAATRTALYAEQLCTAAVLKRLAVCVRNWGVLATAVAFYAEQSCKAEKARRMYAKTGKRRQRSLCI